MDGLRCDGVLLARIDCHRHLDVGDYVGNGRASSGGDVVTNLGRPGQYCYLADDSTTTISREGDITVFLSRRT